MLKICEALLKSCRAMLKISSYFSEAVWWRSWRWIWALNGLHFLWFIFVIVFTLYIALVVVVIIISFFEVKCCVFILVHLKGICQRGDSWTTDLASLLPEPDSEKVDDFKDWGERGSSDKSDDSSCHTKHLEHKQKDVNRPSADRLPQSRMATDECSGDCLPSPSKPPTLLSLTHTQGRSPARPHN